MGNMGLTLSKVPATVVVDAVTLSGADAAGECDLQRWLPNVVAISNAHKRIAILDLCRPSGAYGDQLEAAAALKQDGYSPLLHALDFYARRMYTHCESCSSLQQALRRGESLTSLLPPVWLESLDMGWVRIWLDMGWVRGCKMSHSDSPRQGRPTGGGKPGRPRMSDLLL
jgi:hypothetical protein